MEKKRDLKDHRDYIFDWLTGDTTDFLVERPDALQGHSEGRIEAVLDALHGGKPGLVSGVARQLKTVNE